METEEIANNNKRIKLLATCFIVFIEFTICNNHHRNSNYVPLQYSVISLRVHKFTVIQVGFYDTYLPTIEKMINSIQIHGTIENPANTKFVPHTENGAQEAESNILEKNE